MIYITYPGCSAQDPLTLGTIDIAGGRLVYDHACCSYGHGVVRLDDGSIRGPGDLPAGYRCSASSWSEIDELRRAGYVVGPIVSDDAPLAVLPQSAYVACCDDLAREIVATMRTISSMHDETGHRLDGGEMAALARSCSRSAIRHAEMSQRCGNVSPDYPEWADEGDGTVMDDILERQRDAALRGSYLPLSSISGESDLSRG